MANVTIEESPKSREAFARTWRPQLRRPHTGKPRFLGVDAARGVAILGMVVAHTIDTPPWGSEPAALLGFAHGRSAILFATIAGVSLALMSGGTQRLSGERMLRSRMAILGRAIALLFVAGFMAMFPTSISIILACYAFWFIVALPALRWRPKTLLIVAVALAASGKVLTEALTLLLPPRDMDLTSLGIYFIPDQLTGSAYPAFIWMTFVLAGLALGRCGLDNPRALRHFLLAGLALFAVFAAPFVAQAKSPAPLFGPSDVPISSQQGQQQYCYDAQERELHPCSQQEYEDQDGTLSAEDIADYNRLLQELGGSAGTVPQPPLDLQTLLWSFEPHSGTLFEAFSSGGLALATIAGLVLLGQLPWSRWLLAPLTGIGSMALTAYVSHLLVLSLVSEHFPALRDGLGGWLVLGLVLFGMGWSRIFISGPLEQVLGAIADRLSGKPTCRAAQSL